MRYFLEFHGQSVELLPGETLLGRDLACRIRFNDAVLSRRHLRFCCTDADCGCGQACSDGACGALLI